VAFSRTQLFSSCLSEYLWLSSAHSSLERSSQYHWFSVYNLKEMKENGVVCELPQLETKWNSLLLFITSFNKLLYSSYYVSRAVLFLFCMFQSLFKWKHHICICGLLFYFLECFQQVSFSHLHTCICNICTIFTLLHPLLTSSPLPLVPTKHRFSVWLHAFFWQYWDLNIGTHAC
jgi:hypothetical protein